MSIVIKIADEKSAPFAAVAREQEELFDIITDTEAEITALGPKIAVGSYMVKAKPGSMAYTADMSAVYQMSPSGKWTKVG